MFTFLCLLPDGIERWTLGTACAVWVWAGLGRTQGTQPRRKSCPRQTSVRKGHSCSTERHSWKCRRGGAGPPCFPSLRTCGTGSTTFWCTCREILIVKLGWCINFTKMWDFLKDNRRRIRIFNDSHHSPFVFYGHCELFSFHGRGKTRADQFGDLLQSAQLAGRQFDGRNCLHLVVVALFIVALFDNVLSVVYTRVFTLDLERKKQYKILPIK